MMRESIGLSTSSGGTQIPVPASTARAWVIETISYQTLLGRLLARREERGGGHAALVEHRHVAVLDEAVEGGRTLAVEPGRRVRAVDPDLQRRPVADGRHLVVDLLRQPVEHVDGAAVAVAAEQAGLDELAVRVDGAPLELLAERVVRFAGRGVVLLPEVLDEGLRLRVVLEGQEFVDLPGGGEARGGPHQ